MTDIVDCDRMKMEFWHRPDICPRPDAPFAFRISNGRGAEMGVWLSADDIRGYIEAMHRGLAGEVSLNDGKE